MRLASLFRVLDETDLDVVAVGEWFYLGRDLERIDAIVVHTTVTPDSTSDLGLARYLQKGRDDLAGPLYHVGITRSGVVHVLAGGKANHNGYGRFGNQSVGVALYNDGDGDPHPSRQLASLFEVCTVLARVYDVAPPDVVAHKETDPGRKSDPKMVLMPSVRTHVSHRLDAPTPPEDDMALTPEQATQLAATALRTQAIHELTAGIAAVIADDEAVATRHRDSLAALIRATHPGG